MTDIKQNEQSIKIKFGQKVRRIRTLIGLSQEQLALESGLDRTYIGSVERGQRNISIVNIEKVAKALKVSTKDIMDLEE
jgi:transcriptional regulator with XRE-family HTH domain